MQHDTTVITMILRYFISGLLGIWILGTTAVLGFYSPQHVMVDVTNDFGVCVLQLISSKKENIAFSPYGLVSVALVLYEGSTGPSAAEIHNSLRLPWDREVTRVGFRDMHRYLKSYFSNDGFLRGLVLSKPNIGLRKNYTDLLQFYGFDVRTSQPHIPHTPGPSILTTMKPIATPSTPITTSKPLQTTTIAPARTTTTYAPDTTTLFTFSSKFGSTSTENPKQQTTLLTTLNEKPGTTLPPQTNLPSSRTTLERATETTTVPSMTASRATSAEPSTTTPATTTMKLPETTTTTPTQRTTTMPPDTTPPKQKPTTTFQSPTTTTSIPTTSKSLETTKAADSTQAGTTLDVVTMTDKKPNTPEIMSQVNISALTTTSELKSDMPSETTTPTHKPTTSFQSPTTTTFIPKTTSKSLETTKAADSTQAGTTLDAVTMTDTKLDTPEIMSQVNISALTTTAEPKTDMQGREGDSDTVMTTEKYPVSSTTMMNITTHRPQETTKQTSMQEATTTVMELEMAMGSTTNKASSTTMPPSQEATTSGTSNTVEVSVAETTVVKTVSVADSNTTPTPFPGNEPTFVPEEYSTIPIQPGGVTLVIETTTSPPSTSLNEDNTVMASESMIDQATNLQQSEVTTKPPDDYSNPIPSEGNITTTTDATTIPSTTGQIIVLTEGVAIQDSSTTPETTTAESESPTTMEQRETTIPQTNPAQPTPTQTTLEMIDSAASENRLVAALARQQRSLYSTHKTPEHHQSGSNWVPQYYDQRWGHNPSNEFWFFTYTGGENVQAHTYTAYLPFAFIPELSSLALQLPLDDPRYSIMILLPEERMGLSQLLYSLQWCPVRAIITHLKMTAVYAVVPAFTIVKHINLVPALAKLGIHSVFDPFRADLSPMTSEPHLFVRTIEQVVTVSLRKYYASNRWFEAAPGEVQQHFVANHPFVYFVLDKETDVTLMAGTIVNPVAHNQ